jgi:hypothetical protein
MSHTLPPAYSRALDALAGAVRDAHALADLLEYAAGVLRGRAPDLDGPPLDLCPGSGRILAVLGRRDRALAEAERAWDALLPSIREELQPPGELLELACCA